MNFKGLDIYILGASVVLGYPSKLNVDGYNIITRYAVSCRLRTQEIACEFLVLAIERYARTHRVSYQYSSGGYQGPPARSV